MVKSEEKLIVYNNLKCMRSWCKHRDIPSNILNPVYKRKKLCYTFSGAGGNCL